MRVLSGIQPTGRFHWGNYFGAIRQYIDLQNNEQAFYFIADLHADHRSRTGRPQKEHPGCRVDLLALGLNPDQAALFCQSDVPEVSELQWLLMTVTQMSLLEKCVSYKDKKAKGIPADAGLFTYPVLMAADILLYDSELVPVGGDQIQHIEVTRDIAQRFNSIFGEVLVLPNAKTLDESAKVPGVDGEKMSKSYGNTIELFPGKNHSASESCRSRLTPRPLKTRKIPTRQRSISCDCRLPRLPSKRRWRHGIVRGMGYGEAKQALFEAAWSYFAAARARREQFSADPATVDDILQAGAKRAREKGAEVLDRVRTACGLPEPQAVIWVIALTHQV